MIFRNLKMHKHNFPDLGLRREALKLATTCPGDHFLNTGRCFPGLNLGLVAFCTILDKQQRP